MYDPMQRLAMINPAPAQQEAMIPYAPEEMDQRILQAVMGEQAIKKAKAPKITQEEAKRRIASTEGDNVNFQMSAPVPASMMNQFQKEEDKTHQEVVREYMKKREALAKNAEDRARIMGDSFQGQVDLSPLMALSDTWFGGNLAKSYRAPETLQQNMAAQQQFENQSRAEYGKLTDDEMNMLRQNLLGEQWEHKQKMDAANLGMRQQEINAKRAASGQKPLAAESIKRLDYIVDGNDALTRMKKAVTEGQAMRPDIPLVGDNDFTTALRDAAENYGRMQSGGAISKPEEERFVKAVWKMGDTRAEVLKKIEKQMTMMNNRKTRLLSGGHTLRAPSKTTTQTYNAPEVGTKKGGYEFLGGNPNDQKSWRKI
jgi:hypothetical protein